jgi:AcrR family transcriptional regulator
MARLSREEAHTAKRNAILDVAQQLVYSIGYERMTIQDLLDTLHISKGAFYYYFDSKPAVLEALVERAQADVEALLLPIARDSHLSALDKLQRFFPVLARWKTARKDFLLELARVLYSDDNALFRQKTRLRAVTTVTPLLTRIIHQGISEGVVTTAYPDEVSEVVICLVLDLGDTLARLLLAGESWHDGLDELGHMDRIVAVYTDALERVLGVSPGSVPLVQAGMLAEWVKTAPTDTSREARRGEAGA